MCPCAAQSGHHHISDQQHFVSLLSYQVLEFSSFHCVLSGRHTCPVSACALASIHMPQHFKCLHGSKNASCIHASDSVTPDCQTFEGLYVHKAQSTLHKWHCPKHIAMGFMSTKLIGQCTLQWALCSQSTLHQAHCTRLNWVAVHKQNMAFCLSFVLHIHYCHLHN